MIEIPEASTLAAQLSQALGGQEIVSVAAASSEHKFAFFSEEPETFSDMLVGQIIGEAEARGGGVCLWAGDMLLRFSEGINMRIYLPDEKRPAKHQFLMETDRGVALICTVSMYGFFACSKDGVTDNQYLIAAGEKPSPLTKAFDWGYFLSLYDEASKKLSVKAFLATEQRIPGLGNGVLQDILYNARLHPKKKLADVTEEQLETLYASTVATLSEMTALGGRDTEKDLYGEYGRYITRLSKKTVNTPCTKCGTVIKKASYLGGSIYFCEGCQET
jgi:formamidopyrimidine-DNA glycosylase